MLRNAGRFAYERFSAWMNHEVEPPDRHMSDLDRAALCLKPGDVILVEGRSRIASVIKTVTQSCWTHVALYVGRVQDHKDPEIIKVLTTHCPHHDNQPLLLEAELGSGTLVTTLNKYQDYHVRICRPTTLTVRDRDAVLLHTLNRVGLEYDIRLLFDLARWVFPICLFPRRWGSCLFDKENRRGKTHTICSTLIAEAFYAVEFPIRPEVSGTQAGNPQLEMQDPRLCTPKDFDVSPYFDILKFPLLQLATAGGYHQLPWTTLAASQAEATTSIPVTAWIQNTLQRRYLWLRQWAKFLIKLPANR